MPAAAFITTSAPLSLRGAARPQLSALSRPPRARRARVRAMAEAEAEAETGEKPASTEQKSAEPPAFEAPSFDTEVFSKFIDSAQEKVDAFSQQVQDIDTDVLLGDTKEASIGLIDNLLAGDWLNRGELYGAIQLVFVILLLRAPGGLDGFVSFLCGPLVLLAGAVISGKALFDLGRKQLSIWPAPVPDAELRTDGMYEYVRHPIYSGLLLASVGFAVSTGSPARMALALAFAAFIAKKVEVEEEFLADTYPEYGDYCDKVKSKILPGIF